MLPDPSDDVRAVWRRLASGWRVTITRLDRGEFMFDVAKNGRTIEVLVTTSFEGWRDVFEASHPKLVDLALPRMSAHILADVARRMTELLDMPLRPMGGDEYRTRVDHLALRAMRNVKEPRGS